VWAMLNHFEFFSDKTLGQAFKSADQSMVITGHQLPSSLPMATFMGTLRYTVVCKLLQHVFLASNALVAGLGSFASMPSLSARAPVFVAVLVP
jgi:hypothetical protein